MESFTLELSRLDDSGRSVSPQYISAYGDFFSGDHLARNIVDVGHDWLRVLKPDERLFVPCLILTYQEHLADQQLYLSYYDDLEPSLPPEMKIFRTIFKEHLQIISLCGTFPHRDHYYGRHTSEVGHSLMENPRATLRSPTYCIKRRGQVRTRAAETLGGGTACLRGARTYRCSYESFVQAAELIFSHAFV